MLDTGINASSTELPYKIIAVICHFYPHSICMWTKALHEYQLLVSPHKLIRGNTHGYSDPRVQVICQQKLVQIRV